MSRSLLPLVESFRGRRILVVGDLILDHYLEVHASNRRAAECPGAIDALKSERFSAGGAGAVAAILSALAADVAWAGLLETSAGPEGSHADFASRKLVAVMPGRAVSSGRTERAVLGTWRLPRKVRIVRGGRIVQRIDDEQVPAEADVDRWWRADDGRRMKNLARELAGGGTGNNGHSGRPCAALIISDYAKGTCTPCFCRQLVTLAASRRIPVLVDPPAVGDWTKYAGTTVLKPNLSEWIAWLERCGGRPPILSRHLVVTRGEEGIELDGRLIPPAKVVECIDVTGAGDTVAAVLGLTLACGADLDDGVRLANVAAALQIGRLGVSPIGADELRQAIERDFEGVRGGRPPERRGATGGNPKRRFKRGAGTR
jgi:D-beta-D-heptose 7-phosphate kinase/D-beta-D-heptose 1-phosphate adenosyltransferase